MKWIYSFFFFLCFTVYSTAQVFLQIEKINSPKTIKLAPGEFLEYTLKEYPDVWRRSEILDLKFDENLIVFEDTYRNLDELDKVRLYRKWAKSTGHGMMQFGGAWFLFGGIASLADPDYEMSGREVVIGALFAGIGYLIKKIFYKKTLKLTKKARLRIVDLSFFNDGP